MRKSSGSLWNLGTVFGLAFGVIATALACTGPNNLNDDHPVFNQDDPGDKAPVFALYGFSRGAPQFLDKSDEEILEVLKSWKVNAVFGAHKDPELSEVLRRGGIVSGDVHPGLRPASLCWSARNTRTKALFSVCPVVGQSS